MHILSLLRHQMVHYTSLNLKLIKLLRSERDHYVVTQLLAELPYIQYSRRIGVIPHVHFDAGSALVMPISKERSTNYFGCSRSFR